MPSSYMRSTISFTSWRHSKYAISGRVAGLGERLEAGAHEGGDATAQHGLLAEQVGLGLLGERGLDHTGAGAADGVGVRHRHVASVARGVLRDRDQRRHAATLGVGATHEVTGTLRGDHDHVARRPAAGCDRSGR